MVTGIERWKEYFNDYKDKYVLIGGAACNLLEEELDMNPQPAIRCAHRTHKCRRRLVQPVSHLDG